jgi:hypothetical protein
VISLDVNTLYNYIALYGAGLSTATFLLLFITRYLDRRIRIDVRVSNGLAPFGAEEAATVILVDASNKGGRETTLGTMSFELTEAGKQVFFAPKNYYRFPSGEQYEFAPGKADLRVVVRMGAFITILKKERLSGVVSFKAVFRGVANKTHESKEMLFDVEKGGVFHKPGFWERFRSRFRRKNKKEKGAD